MVATRSGVRVLLLANTLPPRDVSGVGEQVLQLAAGLTAAGFEVEVAHVVLQAFETLGLQVTHNLMNPPRRGATGRSPGTA